MSKRRNNRGLSGIVAGVAVAFYRRGGNSYGNKGDYDRAIRNYNKAIRVSPYDAEAFNGRGVAYANKGESDEAILNYNFAIRIKPNLAEAFYNRGVAYDDKGEYDRAILDYDEAIRINPDYAEAFNSRGIAYANKGDYDRAILDYNKVIRKGLLPRWFFIGLFMFGFMATLWTFFLVLSELSEGLDRSLSWAWGVYVGIFASHLLFSIVVWLDLLGWLSASGRSRIKLNKTPNVADAFNNRGIAYTYKGEYRRAILDYNFAIRRNREYVEAYMNRGCCYAVTGENILAIKDFDNAVRLSSDDYVRNYIDNIDNNRIAQTQGGFDAILELLEAFMADTDHYDTASREYYKGVYLSLLNGRVKARAKEMGYKPLSHVEQHLDQLKRE